MCAGVVTYNFQFWTVRIMIICHDYIAALQVISAGIVASYYKNVHSTKRSRVHNSAEELHQFMWAGNLSNKVTAQECAAMAVKTNEQYEHIEDQLQASHILPLESTTADCS